MKKQVWSSDERISRDLCVRYSQAVRMTVSLAAKSQGRDARELLEEAGVARSAALHFFTNRGRQGQRMSTLVAVSRALGISVQTLLSSGGEVFPTIELEDDEIERWRRGKSADDEADILAQLVTARLRKFVKPSGMSPGELSVKCGLHRTYVHGVMSGKSKKGMTLLSLVRVARMMGTTPDRLVALEYTTEPVRKVEANGRLSDEPTAGLVAELVRRELDGNVSETERSVLSMVFGAKK